MFNQDGSDSSPLKPKTLAEEVSQAVETQSDAPQTVNESKSDLLDFGNILTYALYGYTAYLFFGTIIALKLNSID